MTLAGADNPNAEVWIRQHHPVVERVAPVVEPLLRSEGYELVDLEFSAAGRATLRVFVDRAGREVFVDPAQASGEDGVTLDELTGLTRLISDALDVHEPVSGRYHLEVSSPGLERPLCTRRDFERARGLAVSLKTATKIAGRQRFKGVLQAVEEQMIHIVVDQEEAAIPVTELAKARLEYAPQAPQKPGRRRARS